ncbi:MAG TPA: cyclic nucleotide-binding and patatin-like phospholipase domain-containing protein [Acidimicrobiales bacterium]|nr:cyclic nucleotide-binding and patatin-like phospholipase domain-containing protein [Acidimicrobiales bacterium]
MLEERLRAVPFFRSLPGESLRVLAASLAAESHPAGAIVFREGDEAEALYLVESGRVEVRRGGEALAALGPGSFVGELGLLLGEPRSADLVALDDTELWVLHRIAVDELLERHPAIGVELSRELARRLLRSNDRTMPPAPVQAVAFFGDAAALDRMVDELTDLCAGPPLVLPPGDPLPRDAAGSGERLVLAVLPPHRTREARAVLRTATHVVCTRRPPEWVTRRHDATRVLSCEGSLSIERAARWVTGRAVGLALSSGGSKTVAHLGVVRQLQAAGVPIDAIAASSGGAMIAAAVAAGIPHERRLRYLAEVAELLTVRRWDFNVPPRTGVMKGKRIRDALDRMLEGRTFADLHVPLFVVATDLGTGAEVVLDSGSVADAVRASLSIPGAFDPWRVGGRLLIDGAVVNPMPASVLRDRGLPVVIGSMVAGKRDDPEAAPLASSPPIMQTMLRMVNLMEREMIERQLPLVDVLIRPEVEASYSFDFTNIDPFIAEGARAAKETLARVGVRSLGGRGAVRLA